MLRKVTIVTIALLMVSSMAFAGGWSYGAKLGLNIASMTYDPTLPSAVTVKSRTGFGIGGIVNYNLNDKMDIRTDVLYLQKGDKLDYPGGSGETKLDYIAIDPTFSYKFANWDCKINPGHAASAFFEIGPEIAIKMSAKDQDGKKIDDAKSSDIGLNIGVGVNIPVGMSHLTPEIRYNMGLTKAYDKSTGTAQSAKNNGIQILFGYMF